MSSPVGECWRLAGETLRICSDQTAGPKRHLVDLAQPDHAPAGGGQLIAGPAMIMPGLPSGRRVIALWEADEVTRTRSLPRAARAELAPPIISETCPPGEGDLFRVFDRQCPVSPPEAAAGSTAEPWSIAGAFLADLS